MDELTKKISEYKVFNFLLPGVLFSFGATKLTSFNLLTSDIVVGLFFYYFVGLTISRIGSLIIEPALLGINFIKHSSYKDFLEAVTKDPKIDNLVESANTYRTIAAGFIGLSIVYGFDQIPTNSHDVNIYILTLFFLVLLSVLFLISYRKQVSYVKRRVER